MGLSYAPLQNGWDRHLSLLETHLKLLEVQSFKKFLKLRWGGGQFVEIEDKEELGGKGKPGVICSPPGGSPPTLEGQLDMNHGPQAAREGQVSPHPGLYSVICKMGLPSAGLCLPQVSLQEVDTSIVISRMAGGQQGTRRGREKRYGGGGGYLGSQAGTSGGQQSCGCGKIGWHPARLG